MKKKKKKKPAASAPPSKDPAPLGRKVWRCPTALSPPSCGERLLAAAGHVSKAAGRVTAASAPRGAQRRCRAPTGASRGAAICGGERGRRLGGEHDTTSPPPASPSCPTCQLWACFISLPCALPIPDSWRGRVPKDGAGCPC